VPVRARRRVGSGVSDIEGLGQQVLRLFFPLPLSFCLVYVQNKSHFVKPSGHELLTCISYKVGFKGI